MKRKNLVAIAAGLVLGGVIIYAVPTETEADRQAKAEELRATCGGAPMMQAVAREGVKGSLKAPSTAEFVGWSDEVRANDDTYWVLGEVDAQNVFGAMIRNKYIVRLHCTPGSDPEIVQIGIAPVE